MRRCLAVSLLPVLAGCTGTAVAPQPQTTRVDVRSGPDDPVDPELLVATCTPSGLTLSSRRVSATAAGVRLSVRSTGATETYLNLGWDDGGEGDPAPRQATDRTTPIPPGPVQVSCATLTREWPAVTVTVSDDAHHWSTTTLSDLGCPPGITPAWAISGPGRGPTAESAVLDLVGRLPGTDWSDATPARADIGYPESPVQTWLVARSGRPEISTVVTASDAGFEATPDTICHA